MDILLSPVQQIAYERQMRLELFEASFDDDWECVQDENFSSYSRLELRKMKFEGGVLTATVRFHSYKPVKKAVDELNDLAKLWRTRGWNDFADSLINRLDSDGDNYDLTTELTRLTERSKKIVIKNPKFLIYKEICGPLRFVDFFPLPPPSHSRITGLSISNLALEKG